MTWEEDFHSDEARLVADDGKLIGSIQPVGAAWKVIRNGEIVAIRPDKISAQNALNKLYIAEGKQ